MDNPAAMLHCPNTRCQAPNPQSNKFCQKCRTPLLRRYLWAIGSEIEGYKPGDLLANRYLVVDQQILLETKPGRPPETPQEIPANLAPYLRLSPYGLHIPQIYGRVTPTDGRHRSEIWLLEDAAIAETEATGTPGHLLPELTHVWQDAPAMRQLNWLWQLANLWQPLSSEGVASSLLYPILIRVEGSVVRLLQLQPDSNPAPTLQQLGQLWSQQLAGTSPTIGEFFQQLCNQLIDGQIRTSEQLVEVLDRGLKKCGRSQSHTYQVVTRTDSGPSRPHNEDACYPPSGQLLRLQSGTDALAIVCDGIGGHEGGEVASALAINTLRDRVEQLPVAPDNWNPVAITLELERAACDANDIISQQNDHENRSERQRMGTTLVMARSYAHEMYITHVGDSRVYWITRSNCHQVTQDDDLASREVRLGYALYRGAVQQPTSGSLVQALGMSSSTSLHPTVQRFVLDEDCVFLLCSDGLSDNDRVEQYWKTEILPILEGRVDLPTAGARLIQIANTQNGHDNATVALLHCQVKSSQEIRAAQVSSTQSPLPPPSVAGGGQTPLKSAAPSQMKTQQLSIKEPKRRPWGLLLGIIVLLALGGAIAYVLLPRRWVEPLLGSIGVQSSPTTQPSPIANPTASPAASPVAVSPGEVDSVIQVVSSTTTNPQGKTVPLLLRRGLPPENQSVIGFIPANSVLQVITKSPAQQQESWVQLKVCTPSSSNSEAQQSPSAKTPAESSQGRTVEQSQTISNPQSTTVKYRQVQVGDSGWIREAELLPVINPNFVPESAQPNPCLPPASSPTSTPIPIPPQSP